MGSLMEQLYYLLLKFHYHEVSKQYTESLAPADFCGAVFTSANFQKIAQIYKGPGVLKKLMLSLANYSKASFYAIIVS